MPDAMPDERARPEELTFRPDAVVPNNPVLPVLVWRGVLDPGAGPAAQRRRLEANGWGGTWTAQVFPFHHYHPNAHEALFVAEGRATLVLGGASGREVEVAAGDALLLPAGTGHCRIASTPGFAVCGGYPPGQEDYDLLRDRPAGVEARIAAVALPATDPVTGGALPESWRR